MYGSGGSAASAKINRKVMSERCIPGKDEILMKKNLVVGLVLAVVVGAGFFAGWQYYIQSRTNQEISKRVDEISYVESLGYENLKVGFRGNRVDLSNVSLKIKGVKEIIRAEEISVYNIKTSNRHVLRFNVEIKGVGIALKSILSDESYQVLNVINPDELFSDIGWFYQYDPDHRVLSLENIKITAPELAKLEADIRLINVDPSTVLPDNMAGFLPQLLGMSISQAGIIYNDHSLMEKMLSAQNGSTTESGSPAAREAISENANQMLLKEKNEKTRIVLENFIKFLDHPEKMHITLAPEKPVPLSRFLWVRNLNDLVQLLNMRIEI